MRKINLFALTLALFSLASAADTAPRGIRNLFYDNSSLTLGHSILGNSCYSMRMGNLDLDCNPAFLSHSEKRQFRINLIGNDRLSKLNKYRQQLDDKDPVAMVDSLERAGHQTTKAAASLWYQDDWWAVGFVPMRAGFTSYTRNPAYPRVSAQVFKELEIFGKVGLLSSDDNRFKVGVQTRYVRRDYIYQEFDVFDVITDRDLVDFKHEDILFVEPGVAYEWDSDWHPTLAATLMNVSVYRRGDTQDFKPLMDVGFGNTWAPVSKRFRSTTHYTHRTERANVFSRFSWSALYDFDDTATAMLTLGDNFVGLGLEGHIDSVVLGVGYKSEQISPDQWYTKQISTWLFQAGLVF